MLMRTVAQRGLRLGVGVGRAHIKDMSAICGKNGTGSKQFFSSSGEETTLFSWGIGTDGQLGHGRFQKSSGTLGSQEYVQEEPRKLIKSKRFKAVAPGTGFTLGLSHDGELFGWGSEFLKGCQSNEPTLISVPFVNSGAKIVSISAGDKHACVVDSDGYPYSWGYGGSWFSGGGMLGHGDKVAVDEPRCVERIFRSYFLLCLDVYHELLYRASVVANSLRSAWPACLKVLSTLSLRTPLLSLQASSSTLRTTAPRSSRRRAVEATRCSSLTMVRCSRAGWASMVARVRAATTT
jgi:hypothetical protein